MKLSSYRRIYKQDYPAQYQSVIDQLATPINAAFSELYSALSNNLNFADNFSATLTTFGISVDENGIPLNNTQFKLTNNQTTANGILVLNTIGTDGITLPTSGLSISFKLSNGSILIQNIKGLVKNVSYNITVLVI